MATPSTSSPAAGAPTPASSSAAPSSAPSATAPANAPGRQRRRTRLDALLDLPAFLASAFLLYWSLPIAALLGRVRFWQLRGRRDDALGW